MTIVTVKPIPLDLSAGRLAEEAGLPVERAASTLEGALSGFSPAGCFDEVDPEMLGDGREAPFPGGSTVIIGLCTLGAGARDPDDPPPGWEALKRLAVRDALDFLEYRIRLFLKPAGRAPGARLAPGCRELKSSANPAILRHFPPECAAGLTLSRSGEISGPGIAFVYTTADRTVEEGRCATCTRPDCLARRPD